MIENPDRSPAYTAAVRLTLDNGDASITKESARIRETLSGKVAGDGHIVLQGTGQYKDGGGSNWRYRFEGSFEGERFEATGAMLTAARGTKLRDCSMSLRRVSHSQQAKQQAAPAARKVDKAATATPPSPAQSESQPAAAPKPQPTPPAMALAPAQEALPSIRPPTAPPPTAVEPTAAAPAVPQQLENSGSADSTLATRAEIFERLARAAPLAIELEASGKAASAAGKSATRPQSPSSTAQSAPLDTAPPTPATQEARPATSGQAKQREPDLSGANKTLLAMVVAVGGLTAVAFGTRKRWLRRTTRNPLRFAVYRDRGVAADSSFLVSNHVTEESAKHAAACLQACAPEGISYVVDPPHEPLSSRAEARFLAVRRLFGRP